jgi:hypothetical protein
MGKASDGSFPVLFVAAEKRTTIERRAPECGSLEDGYKAGCFTYVGNAALLPPADIGLPLAKLGPARLRSK